MTRNPPREASSRSWGHCGDWIASLLAVVTLTACGSVQPAHPGSSKIAVDLATANVEGLRGPPTGLRAVHYEFCIPEGQQQEAEIRSIDATAQFLRGSRGRIGCSTGQVLVLGNTYQPRYRQVLDRLAALAYVRRIMESHFE